jgi:hypothetical protein
MQSRSVLVVGPGAVGLVVGYHLIAAGVDVTFYVRPQRRADLASDQILYCYDDASLKTLSDYDVVSSAAELGRRRFDFVVLTLDATACRSEAGQGLLRDLGAALRPSSAILIFCGVGLGLRDDLAAATGLPVRRLVEGTLASLSHQTSAQLPARRPTDPRKVAEAVVAYRHYAGRFGFVLVPKPAAPAKDFARLYNRCGVSKCALLPALPYRVYSNLFFCYTVTLELAGWPEPGDLARERAALSLCRGAMRDILRLRQFGLARWLPGRLLLPGLLLRSFAVMARWTPPLDFTAFNRFHHGGKVLAQDLDVLQTCLREGRKQNRSMGHLAELLARFDRHSGAQSPPCAKPSSERVHATCGDEKWRA